MALSEDDLELLILFSLQPKFGITGVLHQVWYMLGKPNVPRIAGFLCRFVGSEEIHWVPPEHQCRDDQNPSDHGKG